MKSFLAVVLCAADLCAQTYPQRLLLEGNRLYFTGRQKDAIASYLAAIRADQRSRESWLNGAVVWMELGDMDKAALWLLAAAELSPQDPAVLTALGETEFRRGNLDTALAAVERALAIEPREPYALVAKGRIELAAGRTREAVSSLSAAARYAPNLTLAHYGLGKALESRGDWAGAAEAYSKAAFGDSSFIHARYMLVLMLMKSGRPHEAWEQTQKLLAVEPNNREFLRLERAIRPQMDKTPRPPRRHRKPSAPEEPLPMTPPPEGRVPMLRIALGTDSMGNILARKDVSLSCSTRFTIVETSSGKVLARGAEKERWQIQIARGKQGRRIELRDPRGRVAARSARPISIRPMIKRGGVTSLHETPIHPGPSYSGPDRQVRGEVEVSLYPGQAAIRLVNVLDLESYTHGVLAGEMPITSPVEALKAQAVVARTHALFIKTVAQRHKRLGYDLCDGPHCQVYSGVRIESGRSRSVVDASRGRVVTYQGRVAHALYSSDCGGHTQSGREVQGWGDVPYWKGVPDGPPPLAPPSSPWALRQWLRGTPAAYCRASAYVHPSHFRWTRVVPAAELEARLDRALGIGKLKAVLPLKRSLSGHLNSVLVRGSKGSRTLTSELRIRGLFGLGSQRSSLFIMETEYDRGKTPRTFIFYGGGWGHGVGLCQSGAMGRAEAGQSYADILKAYYRGTEIGSLRY